MSWLGEEALHRQLEQIDPSLAALLQPLLAGQLLVVAGRAGGEMVGGMLGGGAGGRHGFMRLPGSAGLS